MEVARNATERTVLDSPQPEKKFKSMDRTSFLPKYVCKICAEIFKSAQECLQHERLRHTFDRVEPKKGHQKIINAMLQIVMENQRQELHDKLSASTPNKALDVIFEFYAMNTRKFATVYERIAACLREESRDEFYVCPFAAIFSDLTLRDSDIELHVPYVCKPVWRSSFALSKLQRVLQCSDSFEDISCVKKRRVTIIHCKHSESGFRLQINVSSTERAIGSLFLRDLVRWDNRLHQLFLFIKIWGKQLQIIESGHMSSHCLIILVVFYLQRSKLLPSIKLMQADEPPNCVSGVNYTYNMNVLEAWPTHLSAFNLIRGFFEFYKNFDFENLLISPYLGSAMPFNNLEDDFPEYKAQLAAIRAVIHKVPHSFPIDGHLRVQDPFALCHNIAKSVSFFNLQHFRDCLDYALFIYATDVRSNDCEIYEQLLFEQIEKIVLQPVTDAKLTKNVSMTTLEPKSMELVSDPFLNKTPTAKTYRINPSKADIETLHCSYELNKRSTINYYWSCHYVAVIKELITEIYCITLQSNSSKDSLPLDVNKEQLQRSYFWDLTARIDMWTGRNHQHIPGRPYLECQKAQTMAFKEQRLQDENYIINFHGSLAVLINDQYDQIDVILRDFNEGLHLGNTKPLTKFFSALKCGLQHFKLKEKLEGSATTFSKDN